MTHSNPHTQPAAHRRAHAMPKTGNPFTGIPLPNPVERGQRASDIFKARLLVQQLNRNVGWLQALPRTSEEVEEALFPDYVLAGMRPEDVRSNLNAALWDAGYTPDREDSDNPTWTWEEAY